MNISRLATIALFLSSTAIAQLLPPASALDGVLIQPAGANAHPMRWTNANGLGAYRGLALADFQPPGDGSPDSVLGLRWGAGSASKTSLGPSGGLARLIHLGSAPGVAASVGYSYSGDPTDIGASPGEGAFTLRNSLQAPLEFGDYADLRLESGEIEAFDFWATVDGNGPVNFFAPAAGNGVESPRVRWTQQPFAVNTFVGFDAEGEWLFGQLDTYLVALQNTAGDTDALFALQLIPVAGGPLGAVPEPSTYAGGAVGLIAVVALLRKRRQAAC